MLSWTVIGTLASVIDLGVGIYVIVVARGAREAAKGKYNITLDRVTSHDEIGYWASLKNTEGRELLTVHHWVSKNIKPLFELARRRSLNVDAAIEEIMGDNASTDPDIPF